MGFLLTAFLFFWVFYVGMGGIHVSFGFWAIVTLGAVVMLAYRLFTAPGGNPSSNMPTQEPSFDERSPSRIRTNWDDPGFKNH